MSNDPRSSYQPGDAVVYQHDVETVLGATVLGPFDDGYVIQLDPPRSGVPIPEIASRLLDEVNEFFLAHGEELLDYQDALFVSVDRLRPVSDPHSGRY